MSRLRSMLRILLVVAIVVAQVAIRFRNPHLTESELFVEFWWLHLACVTAALVAASA